jgi:hypothetical protein
MLCRTHAVLGLRLNIDCLFACMSIAAHMFTALNKFLGTLLFPCIYVCIYMYMYITVCIYLYIYIYICTNVLSQMDNLVMISR